MKITEDNFVEQLKKHNEQALVYVIDTYGWVLKTVVKRQMATLEHLWDDCMNDTLLAVWNNIDSFQPEKNEFQNWLAGVCRFKALTYVRKYIQSSREDLVEQMPEWKDEKAEKEFLQREYEEEVEIVLSYLKEEDAKIFRMIYLEDLTMDEVAEKMQMSKTVIYGRISRGKKQIRRSLAGNEV
ncbi:MAG: sigma-70 family RNA polymerase sigma factor [Lachnospiraceae bacterium]|nr:sigma-70 family RNA polymerase sigma factor [Lachnospiraceae bacterium]MDD5853826.1 sigma-70 family RNA polymerase sigma factor [Lachnospiraceae bacterium]